MNESTRCDTIVVSFQRSGMNWIRYCVEHFSGRPTPGYVKLVGGEDFVFHRTHDVRTAEHGPNYTTSFFDDDGKPAYRRVLLLIRDPAESLVRQVRKALGVQGIESGLRMMDPYIANLEAVRLFEGEKLVVHYEDLVADFSTMLGVLAFLGVTADAGGFDLSSARSASLAWYEAHHGSHTKNDLFNFTFHSRELSADEHRALWDHLTAAAPVSVEEFWLDTANLAKSRRTGAGDLSRPESAPGIALRQTRVSSIVE